MKPIQQLQIDRDAVLCRIKQMETEYSDKPEDADERQSISVNIQKLRHRLIDIQRDIMESFHWPT
jgi:hypothetical protein